MLSMRAPQLAAGCLVFVFSLQVPLFPIRACNDTWWHLKTGRYLLETGPLFPARDVFSQTGAEHEWVNHEWLSDILFWLVYSRLGGPMALVVFNSLVYACAGLLLFILARRWSGSLLCATALALAAVWSGQHSVLTRPPTLTYLLLVVFIAALERFWREGLVAARVAPLLALVVLWANLHGGVILAPVATGAYAVSALALRRQARPWLLFSLAVLLACLCNPWGYKLLMLTFKVARDPVLLALIIELQPPEYQHLKVFLGLVVCGVGLLLAARDRRQLPLALFTGFLLWQGLSHVRHVPLAALALALAAAGAVGILRERGRPRLAGCLSPAARRALLAGATALVLLSAALGSLRLVDARNRPFFHFRGWVREAYPGEVCDFLIRHPLPGPMLNDVNYAGYLIWRLSPERYKVYTDSRFDIHGSGPARMLSSLRAANDPFTVALARAGGNPILGDAPDDTPYWRAILDWLDPGFIVTSTVVYPNHRLEARLAEEGSGWAKVFASPERVVPFSPNHPPWFFGGYALYVRDTPENAELIASARQAWLEERLK